MKCQELSKKGDTTRITTDWLLNRENLVSSSIKSKEHSFLQFFECEAVKSEKSDENYDGKIICL